MWLFSVTMILFEKKRKKNGIRSNIARYNISSVKLVFASQIVESHFSKEEVCRVTHKYTCFIDYNGYLRAEKTNLNERFFFILDFIILIYILSDYCRYYFSVATIDRSNIKIFENREY